MSARFSRPETISGSLLIATAVVALALLAGHPGGAARDFAGLVAEEAANRGRDALVHGGFIALLGIIVTGQVGLARHLGLERPAVVAGLVFFCAGAGALAASLLVDGLVIPDMAVRLMASPDRIAVARPVFMLATTLMRFLMPLGILLQGIAIGLWGAVLLHGKSRVVGTLGAAIGLVILAGMAVTQGGLNPLVLMLGIVLTTVWNAAAGWLLVRAARA